MASGLQCPGCGHVHPAGLPEIARGDETFRCYGCYRTLKVPEGWTGRPSPRPSPPEPPLTGDAPPGAGTRDARTARLAGRRAARRGPRPEPPDGGSSPPAGQGAADVTQMVATAVAAGSAAATRRSDRPVRAAIRAVVWAMAFGLGFVVTAFVLRAVGLLGVTTVIDLYAGSGLHRFGVLLVLLPVWALLSATMAHFALENLAHRRPRRPVSPGSQVETPTPG